MVVAAGLVTPTLRAERASVALAQGGPPDPVREAAQDPDGPGADGGGAARALVFPAPATDGTATGGTAEAEVVVDSAAPLSPASAGLAEGLPGTAAGGDQAAVMAEKIRVVRALRDTVLLSAWRQLGVPYVWGGDGQPGFDCSGLMRYAFGRAGLQIPRTAAEQASMGRPVPVEEAWLAPGDLLVFRAGTHIDHVGMYIGHGRYIHASGSAHRVTISSIRDPRDITHRLWVAGRRVFQLPYRQPAA